MFYSFKNAVSGELASATNPMACIPSPASYAVRPASTACLKAFAISIGLPATAIAVFTRHADAPISIASAAWLGAPIPASTTKKNLSPVLGLEGYTSILAQMNEAGIRIPVVAIGGIVAEDIPAIMETGVNGIALSGAILQAPDPVEETKRILNI